MRRRTVSSDAPRRVLVTGASGGIGSAISLALAADGFDLTLHYRARQDRVEKLAEQVRALGRSVRLVGFDVSRRAEVAEALAEELSAGPLYGVVSNAGAHADSAFPAMKAEQWDDVLDTHLGGFFHVVQPLVMPMIRARRGGRIVVISSLSGVRGNRGQVNYSAAKAGLNGAAKALALELASRGITVNSVAPGWIETEMTSGIPSAAKDLVPMGRLGTPEEVAGVVAFLFSDRAAYMTGQVLCVDGGLS